MNLAGDKALAARRLRRLAERDGLPECVVLDVWRGLERSLATARSDELEHLVVAAFLRDLEERVASRLANDLNTTSVALTSFRDRDGTAITPADAGAGPVQELQRGVGSAKTSTTERTNP